MSYISKPFNQEKLAAAVARAARLHGLQRMRRHAESYQRELYGDQAELEARFARAIDHSWMAFQPIVDVTNKSVFAYEALLRTEEDSMRRPDIFIATAERLDRDARCSAARFEPRSRARRSRHHPTRSCS